MNYVIFASVLVCVFAFPGFKQNGYNMIYERAEVIDCNRDYFSDFKIHNFKQNRTQAASNATLDIIKNVPTHVKLQIEAYKFSSNEYRGFPIQFSYSFCEALLRDDFGIQAGFKNCGNWTATNICPVMKKGAYFFCNFKPNDEKYPPNIPEGSYMLDIKLFHGPTEMLFLQGYGTVKNKPWW